MFSEITPTQYSVSYEWLCEMGIVSPDGRLLVECRGNEVAAELFDRIVLHEWMPDAEDFVLDPDDLPSTVLSAAKSLGLPTNDAFRRAMQIWGKVDTEERHRVGLVGELALVAELRACMNAEVTHVAATSDGFGYDISVEGSDWAAHLEVKTTSRRARLVSFLSRNEFETMRRDPCWLLVGVQISGEQVVSVATVSRGWISASVPMDRVRAGRWHAARLDIPSSAIERGIPSLVPFLTTPSAAIQGEMLWQG